MIIYMKINHANTFNWSYRNLYIEYEAIFIDTNTKIDQNKKIIITQQLISQINASTPRVLLLPLIKQKF